MPACKPRHCPMPAWPACSAGYATRPSGTAFALLKQNNGIPSSKTCSVCGHHNTAPGREPCWSCPGCATIHDRNHNAACNLLNLALLAVGEDVTLLDGEALASDETVAAKLPRMKGEPSPEQRLTPSSRWRCNRCYSFGIPLSRIRATGIRQPPTR